jgi:2,3-bisphosphoglycerate-independent phosphoglycerate mutase
MERAAPILEEHEINTVRADLGENPANGVWIWGGGRPPKREGRLRGLAAGDHPSFVGLAKTWGLEMVSLDDAILAAGGHDLVVVHVAGALDRSRQGDPAGKVAALEEADRRVIRPLVEEVIDREQGRLLVVAGHVASSTDRRDLKGAVPFVLAGPGIKRLGGTAFDEDGAAAADLVVEQGGGLLEFAGRV